MERTLFTHTAPPDFKDLIDEINICIFTTTNPEEHRNHSGIMSTASVEEDGTIWFFANKSTKQVSEIKANSDVHLLYTHPSKKKYVEVWGKAQLLEDREQIEALWNPIAAAWFPQGSASTRICLIKVEPTRAHYWDNMTNGAVRLMRAASSSKMITEDMSSVA